ncbi:MAG: hypothetical protein IKV10_00400 [Alphaproteobacteria bacterium]|nr:hypothetical protein [Alphaproteobacteria bacterium]
MRSPRNDFIAQRIVQADNAKKANPLDLSSDQDLTIGIMNLIAIEELTCPNSELHKTISGIRGDLLSRIVPRSSELYDVSVMLLGRAMSLAETAAHASGAGAYKIYDSAYEAYSLFWGLNMGLIDIDAAKKYQSA